jgi:hypothetical protein
MTVDSIPISELGQRGTGFKASTRRFGITLAYAATASTISYLSLFAFMFIESDLREFSCSACTSGFATHVETRSPPFVHFKYNI